MDDGSGIGEESATRRVGEGRSAWRSDPDRNCGPPGAAFPVPGRGLGAGFTFQFRNRDNRGLVEHSRAGVTIGPWRLRRGQRRIDHGEGPQSDHPIARADGVSDAEEGRQGN